MIYLIFIGSEEKHGQANPHPIFEFKSQKELDKWLKRGGQKYMDKMVENNGELYGGWPTWHELSPGGNDNPNEWLDDWMDEQ